MLDSDWSFFWTGLGSEACWEGLWVGTEALGVGHCDPRCFGGPGVRGCLDSAAPLIHVSLWEMFPLYTLLFFFHCDRHVCSKRKWTSVTKWS